MKSNNKTLIKTQEYLKKANKKWGEVIRLNYLCYESNLELASEIVYKLFEKDILYDTMTYYKEVKTYNKEKTKNIGYIFKVLCELEKDIYFQFDIITRYGIDIPQKITNGKFRTLNKIPKGWKEIEELEELEV